MSKLHYVITLQWSETGALPAAEGGRNIVVSVSPEPRAATEEGTVKPASGTTRQKIFLDVVAHARKHMGIPDGVPAAVIHWSLNENKIA